MNESKKRNIIIGALCGVLLLMAVGYAAFQSVLNIEGTANITSNWNVLITDIQEKEHVGSASSAEDPTHEDLTATFSVNLVSPGDSISYDVTIENQGNLNAVLEKININKTINKAINITYEGITAGDPLNAGDSQVLTIKVEYNPEITSQPEELTSKFDVTLEYVQEGKEEEPSTSLTGILNVGGQEIPVIDDGTDGLYVDPNPEEVGRYVYAGANPDNYITFNEEVWRIVSVEPDKTIKIMKNPTDATLLPRRSFDSRGNRDQTSNGAGGTYCAQVNNGCNIWAQTENFISANGSYTGTVLKDSTMKEYLNEEYYNTITTNKDAIQEHKWYYGSPTWESTDLATQVMEEKKYSAMSNVGLIQASDYIKSNTNTTQCGTFKLVRTNNSTCKPTTWMSKDLTNMRYWVVSPCSINTEAGVYVDCIGDLRSYRASDGEEVAPTIYLKSNIHLEGSGKQDEPYTISIVE